jgi:hypothetical protein
MLQGLEEARDASSAWEAQSQGALAQIELLKDMLEESARWDMGLNRQPPTSPPGSKPPPSPLRGPGLRVRTSGPR